MEDSSAADVAEKRDAMLAQWRVAPGDPKYVFCSGLSKPINCGSIGRAQLIAAAPDMLAFVKRVASQLHGDEQSERGMLIREARALLTKASA